jgi:hypothetical protein
MTAAAMSSERQLRVVPRLDLPTAVREPATITASRVILSELLLIYPQIWQIRQIFRRKRLFNLPNLRINPS